MKPYQSYLIMSELCNMKCTYCVAMYEEYSGILGAEDGFKIVNILLEGAKEKGEMVLDFFGGEPTLFIKDIHTICNYAYCVCHMNNIKLSINMHTNCSVMNQDIIDYYTSFKDNVTVITGLDGAEDIHDKFKRTQNGLPTYKTIVENALKVQEILGEGRVWTYTTILRSTIPRLWWGYMEMQRLGLRHNFYTYSKSLECSPLADEAISAWTDDDFREYDFQMFAIGCEIRKGGIDALNRMQPYNSALCDRDCNTCSAGTTLIAVAPDGKIYPCHGYYAYDSYTKEDHSIGHINEGITKDGSIYTITFEDLGCGECKNKGCSICTSSNLAVKGDMMKIGSCNICRKSSIDNKIMDALVGDVTNGMR